ncbi:MAG: peptide chain release factor N(5)-glutamine methyltransferase [Planctomycetota bacterium]
MSDAWKIVDLLGAAKSFFEKKGITGTARLDAELLLAKVLRCGRIDLYVRFDEVVGERQRAEFREFVRQRGERRPTKQILGSCEFMSHEFIVTPDVLIPRPDTETLVECVLDGLGAGPRTVCDIGTGSGNIAVSISLARPDATMYAVDNSDAALKVAEQNAGQHGVSDRITFCSGDLLGPLAAFGLEGAVDCVVSNPPYVSESEFAGLMPEVAKYEPRRALVSGDDGMSHTARLVSDAPQFLRPGALLAIETSPHVAERAAAAAEADGAYEDVRTVRDLSKAERVLLARKKQ